MRCMVATSNTRLQTNYLHFKISIAECSSATKFALSKKEKGFSKKDCFDNMKRDPEN